MVPFLPIISPAITPDLTQYPMQEAHHQDPEELYVKQDRIGTSSPCECARVHSR